VMLDKLPYQLTKGVTATRGENSNGNQMTQDYLKQRLNYNQETGEFFWKERCVIRWQDKTWNKNFANKKAGTIMDTGYVRILIDGTKHKAHRLAFLYMTGRLPKEQVDHINGIRQDNRWSNLREATNTQNSMNRTPKDKISGVSWNRNHNKWCAYITVEGKRIYLGYFNTKSEAVAERRKAEKPCFGEYSFIESREAHSA
jgi:hypothetical protein